MATRLFSIITKPVMLYFDATIAEPCRSIYGQNDPGIAPLKTEEHRNSRHHLERSAKVKRERKPTFSFFRCLLRQREMCSKEQQGGMVSVDSVREHYLREGNVFDDSSPFVH